MDCFIGKWNLTESENFDTYLKEIGVGMIQRKLMESAKPQIIIEKNGDKWKMSFVIVGKTVVTEFELDKEFEEKTGDGRQIKSVFHFSDGKLTQKQISIKAGGKNTEIERWIEGDKMIVVGECQGVKYRQIHQKVQ